MGNRQICQRFLVSETAQTNYATPTATGSLDKLIETKDPYFVEHEADLDEPTEYDISHEWWRESASATLLYIDGTLSISNIPATPENVTWFMARAMGDYTPVIIAAGPNYTGTIKMLAQCTSVTLPINTIGVAWVGSAAIDKLYVGCVINSISLRIVDSKTVFIDVEFYTDGTEITPSPVFSLPATFYGTHIYKGKGVTAQWEDFGTPYAGAKPFLTGELTINNNLDRDGAKLALAATGKITELELGAAREITFNFTEVADESSADYTDASAAILKKHMEITLAGIDLGNGDISNTVIDLPEVTWKPSSRSYNGNKRIIGIDNMFHYNIIATTPLTITTVTGIVDVLL